MKRLSEKAKAYAKSYGQPPYGREIEGTAELLLQMAEKLEEYEGLEEQGKLLKLPCAVGDMVYSFSCGKILILRVDSFIVYADGIDARLVSDMEEYKFLKVELDITDFGRKWFATHEEAEAALKEWCTSNTEKEG